MELLETRLRIEVGVNFVFSKRPLLQRALLILLAMTEPSGVVLPSASVQHTAFLWAGWVWSCRTAHTNRFSFVSLLDPGETCSVQKQLLQGPLLCSSLLLETKWPHVPAEIFYLSKEKRQKAGLQPSFSEFYLMFIRNVSIVECFRQIRFEGKKKKTIQEGCQYSGSKMQYPN